MTLIVLIASHAQAALLIVCGEAIGIADNHFSLEAGNIVRYAFANGKASASYEFALFQSGNSGTVVSDAITANNHTYTALTIAQLSGFAFGDYRVVILNWDNVVGDAVADQTAAATPALETYIAAGGAVWIQGAIEHDMSPLAKNSFALPFGGTQTNDSDFYPGNWIIDAANPMMAGLGSNPIGGAVVASKSHSADFSADAHVVKRAQDENGVVTLYEYRPPLIFANGFEP
jgi:hypothetical protein